MDKLTIVINGVGGSGKDTLISLLEEHYKVKNISSITPIKEFAKLMGWQGEKTDKARKFLADLKALLTDYNNYPTNYILQEQQMFLSSDEQVLFVHIREPQEIAKFVSLSQGATKTLLIRPRQELQGKVYGNASDDEVEQYNYDYVFNNDLTLEEITPIWNEFFANILENSNDRYIKDI